MNKVKILFLLCLLPSLLFAAFPAGYWVQSGLASLKKDELYSLKVKAGEMKKEVRFRWTLYKNRGLVMHLGYDRFVHQFVLYRDYHRDSFKLDLVPKEESGLHEAPYLMLVFKGYSRATEIADIEYYVYAGEQDVNVEIGGGGA